MTQFAPILRSALFEHARGSFLLFYPVSCLSKIRLQLGLGPNIILVVDHNVPNIISVVLHLNSAIVLLVRGSL
jgi:hypothetical protein